ncbi:hypothetical protein [Bacillus litorisediminis]|uniref:hypothetical protein n=1 Tax=Bacillus litorisediminis TaxID=2922713 RepID=UPI001FB03E8A|nr:hypothetical protein [Bacillus litorisediminis]
MNAGAWAYTSLLIIGIVILIISYRKTKSRRIFYFFLAVFGLILLFDYIIYVWGDAYEYYPNLIKNQYDSKLGGYINAVIIASAATMFSILQARLIWSIGLAILFSMIELLFMRLGVYEQYWWKTGYTFTLLLLHFPIVKVWWNYLGKTHQNVISLLTMISCYYAIHSILSFFQYGIMEIRSFHVEWLERIGQESIALNAMELLLISIFLSCVIFFRKSKTWLLFGIAFSSVIDIGCKRVGLIIAHVPWDWFYYLAADCLSVLAVIYFGEILRKNERLSFSG